MAISKATLLSTLKAARKQQDTRNAAKFVAQEEGKGLSTNDYTTADQTKLAAIAEGAQVNVIEAVSVNGTALSITDKGVNVDLSEYAKSADLTTVYRVKGTVANFSDLPKDAKEGDVYNITNADDANSIKAGDNVVYTADGVWDDLSGTVDLSGYVEKEAGKGLSTNDFTDEAKNQLAALEADKDEQVSEEEIASIFAD